jgi:hypothetical protein
MERVDQQFANDIEKLHVSGDIRFAEILQTQEGQEAIVRLRGRLQSEESQKERDFRSEQIQSERDYMDMRHEEQAESARFNKIREGYAAEKMREAGLQGKLDMITGRLLYNSGMPISDDQSLEAKIGYYSAKAEPKAIPIPKVPKNETAGFLAAIQLGLNATPEDMERENLDNNPGAFKGFEFLMKQKSKFAIEEMRAKNKAKQQRAAASSRPVKSEKKVMAYEAPNKLDIVKGIPNTAAYWDLLKSAGVIPSKSRLNEMTNMSKEGFNAAIDRWKSQDGGQMAPAAAQRPDDAKLETLRNGLFRFQSNDPEGFASEHGGMSVEQIISGITSGR